MNRDMPDKHEGQSIRCAQATMGINSLVRMAAGRALMPQGGTYALTMNLFNEWTRRLKTMNRRRIQRSDKSRTGMPRLQGRGAELAWAGLTQVRLTQHGMRSWLRGA